MRNNRNLNLNASVLTLDAVNAGKAFVLEHPVIGTGGLIISGAGSPTLAGANTYSGGTYIDGGTLRVSSDANLRSAAGTLGFNGGVLQITGTAFTGTARAITLDEGGMPSAISRRNRPWHFPEAARSASLALYRNATLGLGYGGQFGSGRVDQRLQANLSLRF